MERFSDERLAGEKNSEVHFEAATVESNSNDLKLSAHDLVPPYSEKEAQVLAERLANKDSYKEARQVLITWLKKGECNKSNSASFFSLINIFSATIKKLQSEQKECQKKVENTKKNLADHNRLIQYDLNKIGKAFEAVEKQDVWNNFTEIQKNNFKMMKKDYLDLEQDNLLDIVKDKKSTGVKKMYKELQILRKMESRLTSKLNSLREEAKDLETSMHNKEEEISQLKSELERSRSNVNARSFSRDYVRQNETQIICLISLLLVEHYLNGVSIGYIHLYMQSFIPLINENDIEFLLRRFPAIFKEVVFGQERNWVYVGFNVGEWSNIN